MVASGPSMDELDRLVDELRRIETRRSSTPKGDPVLADLEAAEAEARTRLREVNRALELRRTRLELQTELASLEDRYRELVGEEPDFPTQRTAPPLDPQRSGGTLAAVRAVEDPDSQTTLEERIRRVRLRLARLDDPTGPT